jgi:SAM-dependent methyltransferase
MNRRDFPDHFSGIAADYASYRPHYPAALFATLAALAPDTDRAWDCGAGSGQASLGLAAHFAEVIATDASASQLARATPHDRVSYRTAPAEASGLPNASVSLVTVAQALHWFDVPAFHDEVRRVLRPRGVIAEWTYALLEVPARPAVSHVVNALDARLRSWWPPERVHVDERYARLAFPFETLTMAPFAMTAEWTLPQCLGYLATWSAVTRACEATGDDPLRAVSEDLHQHWGDAPTLTVQWPLTVRVGRVS